MSFRNQRSRPPTSLEKEVISKLLGEEFEGRQALLDQFPTLAVERIDDEGSLRLKVSGPRAEVKTRVPVEAMMEDSDGFTIHILLHVIDGLMNELEIYKDNLEAPQKQLSPDAFNLIAY